MNFSKALNLVNRTAETGPRFLDSYQGVFHFPELLAAVLRIWNSPRAGVNKGLKESERQSSGRQERLTGEKKQPQDIPLSRVHPVYFDLTLFSSGF